MDQHSKEFKKLQKKWYKKLEAQGFKDLETIDGFPKDGVSSRFWFRHAPEKFEFQAEYYRQTSYFLHSHKFATAFERLVWERHSNGVSIRDIVADLKKLGIKTYRREVHETLQKLDKQMIEAVRTGQNG